MAYTERKAAVWKQLDETAKTSREVFGKAHDEELEKAVRAHLERYFSDRERALAAGVKLLESPLPPKDHQDRWNRHFSEFGSKQAQEIADLVKDSKLIKTPFVNAVSALASQESAFFAAVAKMPMAWSQGEILQWYGPFEREMKSLRDDRQEIKSDGGEISKDLVEVMEEIREIYAEAVANAAQKVRDAEELILRWLPVAEGTDDISSKGEPGPIGASIQVLRRLLEGMKALRPSVESLMGRFDSLYRSHETVGVILFGKTRSQVEDFLDEVNLEGAVEEFEAASETCVRIAQGLGPPGQRDDAEDLVEAMIDEAHETLEQFEDLFDEFVDEFREVFIGPVGDRTVKDLVDKERSDRETGNFRRLNAQSELRKIYEKADDGLDLPLDSLPSDKREAIEKWLKRDLEALSLAVREASDLATSARFRMVMELAFPRIADQVKRLPGASV
jgi:hypothetical protein